VHSRQTALIIGAGLGGIATAAHLARNGYQVTVIEKNPAPGGRCSQLNRDGHRFDIGPTLFLIPEIFAETYAALGERMEDHLDLRRIDPTYRFHFDNGDQLALTADMNAMQSQLEAIEPGSFGGLLRYLVEGHQHYSLAVKRLAGRNFYSPLDYFSPQNLLLMFKLKGLVKHYDNIGNYFQHPYLKAAFTFQDMYLGLSPFDAPATYSLLQYTELADGVWFPMGGMVQHTGETDRSRRQACHWRYPAGWLSPQRGSDRRQCRSAVRLSSLAARQGQGRSPRPHEIHLLGHHVLLGSG
jgi:phytoene desaturase